MEVVLGIQGERAPVLDDVADGDVSAYVAVLLRFGIIGLGVFIGLLEAGFRFGEIDAVFQRYRDGLAEQRIQSGGVAEAAVQKSLLLGILVGRIRLGGHRQDRIGGLQRICGGQVHLPDRLFQQGVPAESGAGHRQVFRGEKALLLEVCAQAGRVLQRESHVEREFRPLRVQHDGEFVGGFDHLGKLRPPGGVVY